MPAAPAQDHKIIGIGDEASAETSLKAELQVRTGLAAGGRWIRTISPRATQAFEIRLCRLHPRQRKSRRNEKRQHEDTGRLRGTNGSNPASSSVEVLCEPNADEGARDRAHLASGLENALGVRRSSMYSALSRPQRLRWQTPRRS